MKSVIRLAFKVLTQQISKEEFEEEIYSDFYMDRISQDDLIYAIVTVDYRNDNWQKRLEEVIGNHLTVDPKLLLNFYFTMLQLIQLSSKEKEVICNFVEKLANLSLKTDFEYDFLNQFYSLNEEIGLANIGYARESNFIIAEIKNLARDFLKKYDKDLSFDELMTTDNDLISNYESSKTIDDLVEKPFSIESEKSFIIGFIKQRILNLESKKGTFKKLKSLGYSDQFIQENYNQAGINVIPNLKNRILIYSVIGVPILYVGIMSILKKDSHIFLIGFLLIGFGLLLTALLYLVKLTIYWSQK